jgi:hypothetical protein
MDVWLGGAVYAISSLLDPCDLPGCCLRRLGVLCGAVYCCLWAAPRQRAELAGRAHIYAAIALHCDRCRGWPRCCGHCMGCAALAAEEDGRGTKRWRHQCALARGSRVPRDAMAGPRAAGRCLVADGPVGLGKVYDRLRYRAGTAVSWPCGLCFGWRVRRRWLKPGQ